MRKAVLQNRMDSITALQEGTCAINPTECYGFIADKSSNISSLLNCLRAQVNILSDSMFRLEDLINQWFRSWGSCGWVGGRILFGNHYLSYVFKRT